MRIYIVLIIFFINGCSQDESPRGTYERYVQLEISGITVEQFIVSYSERKQLEIEEAVKTQMEKNGLNREQTLQRFLPIFRSLAKCKNLDFLDEKIEGNKATISYKSTDDCMKGQINVKKEIIYMVYESGWKIDNNDIQDI